MSALVDVVDVRAHQRAQDTAAPVRRRDADDGRACARKRAAGDREIERERARAADGAAVLPRGQHPVEWEELREALSALRVRFQAEVLADSHERVPVLGEIAARANLEAHPWIFSSGA